MTLREIVFEWHNVIFTVMFCSGLIYALVYAVMGGGDSDTDHDFDHDVDHDHDSNHDHGDGLGNQGALAYVLSYLGLGRCPISIIFIVLFMTWGFIGLASNAFFSGMKIPYQIYFWFSLAIATVLGVFFTRHLSIFIAKIMPKSGTSAVKVESLVGQHGESKVTIDSSSGYACVKDEYGTLHNIQCKTLNNEVIGVNEVILVLQYLPGGDIFIVTKKPELSEVKK